jgi:uncharacterized protein YkwD
MSNATLARGLHHAKVCFIPYPENNHHPLALRHKSLTAISILLIIAKILAISVIALTPTEATLSTITTSRIVQLTNTERTKQGLQPLTINSALTHAAELKAKDMFANQYFAHISPTGVTPWHWMEESGYSYEIAGENLAIDFTQAEDVVSAWLASPKHKENMLRADYTEAGVAVLSGDFKGATSIIVVHMFGKPLTALAVASPVPTVAPTVAGSVAPTPPPTTILQAKTFVAKANPTPQPSLPTGQAGISPTPSPTASPTPAPQGEARPDGRPEIVSAVLSPSFDAEEFAIAGTTTWQLFSAHSNIATDTDVLTAIPLFTIHPTSSSATVFGATISRMSRDFIGIILLAITAMLTLTILVKIKIQHPVMIGHASLVILLAFALFLA